MCTISLTYDQNNVLAQRKLADLLASGLFKKAKAETAVKKEMKELERRMEAFEKGEMETVPQSEVYSRVMAS
ncbi:MAG: hypothetical protein IJ634_07860 [Bacteroidales bacterium]|nr:hypothetical protein [Bacteroidales bacterium]